MIHIDPNSPVPPYEQVRAGLAEQIATRALPVGTKLPTVRRLAADLDLAVNTVARAYRELEQAGLVETRGRAGSFVSAAGQHARERAASAAREYAAVARALGIGAPEALEIAAAALGLARPGAETGSVRAG